MFFVAEIANDEYHAGQPITLDDVKRAIEGYGCGPECETRGFKVINIVPFGSEQRPPTMDA